MVSGRMFVKAPPATIDEFIKDSIAGVPTNTETVIAARMREGLVADPAEDDTEAITKVWTACEKADTGAHEKFDEQRAAVLLDLVCTYSENRKAIVAGIIRNWVSTDQPSVFSVQLARGLLGQDSKECAATRDFDNATIGKLREAAAAKVNPGATPAK
jgi:hypothetical protein